MVVCMECLPADKAGGCGVCDAPELLAWRRGPVRAIVRAVCWCWCR